MANKELSELLAAGTIDDADLMLIVQGGNSRKVSIADLKAALSGLVSAGSYIAPFKGAMVKRTSQLADVTFPALIPWQAAEYDTNSFWSAGAPTRLTVPNGVTKVKLSGYLSMTSSAAAGAMFTSIYKNGAGGYPGYTANSWRQGTTGFTNNEFNAYTGVLPVVAGDYFEFRINEGGSFEGINDVEINSWFGIEVVEGDAELL